MSLSARGGQLGTKASQRIGPGALVADASALG